MLPPTEFGDASACSACRLVELNCLLHGTGSVCPDASDDRTTARPTITIPALLERESSVNSLVGKTPGGSRYLFPNTPMSYYTGVATKVESKSDSYDYSAERFDSTTMYAMNAATYGVW
mmetsp:Transcript_10571/g.27398  ORF Transcript_10571/g.27398 Transcript_10571/m.27398 type:complete len:119 (-) Transcript_10571:245-601(-)